MIRDHEWFRGLVDQTPKIRGVAIGGVLKRYIKEREKENLLEEPPLREEARKRLFWARGLTLQE
jgi:hypothetical protein